MGLVDGCVCEDNSANRIMSLMQIIDINFVGNLKRGKDCQGCGGEMARYLSYGWRTNLLHSLFHFGERSRSFDDRELTT